MKKRKGDYEDAWVSGFGALVVLDKEMWSKPGASGLKRRHVKFSTGNEREGSGA